MIKYVLALAALTKYRQVQKITQNEGKQWRAVELSIIIIIDHNQGLSHADIIMGRGRPVKTLSAGDIISIVKIDINIVIIKTMQIKELSKMSKILIVKYCANSQRLAGNSQKVVFPMPENSVHNNKKLFSKFSEWVSEWMNGRVTYCAVLRLCQN